jgi:glutamate-1-semialdehyde 2,1-aminomutase
MSCMFFTDADVVDWPSAATSDTERYARYFRGMLERGFTLAPSQFEAAFVSLAHTDDDIDAFVAAATDVLGSLA